MIIDTFDKERLEIIEFLSKSQSKISITADVWTSPVKESFLGVTCKILKAHNLRAFIQ